MIKRALFIVDPQLDFMPNGTLEVKFGDRIVPVINSIMDKFDIIIASRDWHPENHQSFTTQHEGSKILDIVKVKGEDMIIWPPHCVQNTDGAKFHPDLNFKGELFTKGDNPNEHPFSGYVGINSEGKTVEQYLKENEITEVFITGLAGDYCVKETALDCSKHFKTYFILDAIKFIGSIDNTIKVLVENNINIINSQDLSFIFSDKTMYKLENFGSKYDGVKGKMWSCDFA